MKEDILEQLVEDWLQSRGFFTRANLKFKPSPQHPAFVRNKDSVASDIDVIGIHPCRSGAESVFVVGCKSWQDGFWIADMANSLVNNRNRLIGNKEAWKHFRELVEPKWTEAFLKVIKDTTGSDAFTYITAVTVARDEQNRISWEENPAFKIALGNNPIRLITLHDMLAEVFSQLGTTVESSQFSRTLQLIKAAGMTVTLEP